MKKICNKNQKEELKMNRFRIGIIHVDVVKLI